MISAIKYETASSHLYISLLSFRNFATVESGFPEGRSLLWQSNSAEPENRRNDGSTRTAF